MPAAGPKRARLLVAVIVATALAAAPAHAASGGALTVRITGLPPSHLPTVTLRGPDGNQLGVLGGRVILRNLAPGTYSLAAAPARIRRTSGTVRKGATVAPLVSALSANVAAGGSTTVSVRYGTITNPGVRAAPTPVSVQGPLEAPTGLVVAAAAADGIHAGTILTGGPSAQLPVGLLRRVTKVSAAGANATLTLGAAKLADAFPRIVFDGALPDQPAAQLSAPDCAANPSVQLSGVTPSVDLDAAPWDGTVRADLSAALHVTVGLSMTAPSATTCTFTPALLDVAGAIPAGSLRIPVALTVPLSGTLQLPAAVTSTRTLAFDATLGLRARPKGSTLPATPVFQHGTATTTGSDSGAYTLTLNAAPTLAVGPVHGTFATTLTFARSASGCALDWKLVTFSAGGSLGTRRLSAPATPTQTAQLLTACPT